MSRALGTVAGWVLAGATLASLSLSGCATEAFCFACEQPEAGVDTGAGGSSGGSGGTGGAFQFDSGSDAEPDADAGTDAETCTDTQSDPNNCGSCGNRCSIPGAFPKCESGQCVIDQCAGGFVDLDPNLPGCECEQSAGGVELCDQLDNDCDGTADEDFDLLTNVEHCGACNDPCAVLPDSTVACVAGECEYTCDTGWAKIGGTGICNYECPVFPVEAETCDGEDDDCDGIIDNGQPGANLPCNDPCPGGVCQGECQPGFTVCTATGTGTVCVGGVAPAGELCDTKDNDCDGQSDEDFDLQTDELNCGSCGIQCQTGDLCVAGVCQFTCPPDREDVDGDPSNGCEYQCPVFPREAETCDGEDDDCNGLTDDSPTGVGAACSTSCPTPDPCVTAGSCSPYTIAPGSGGCYGVCAAAGETACVGGLLVCQHPQQQLVESCDGVDETCDGRVDEGCG